MEANWLGWLNDPAHPRDHDGPRGFVQLAVPNASKRVINFNEITQSKKLEMQSRLNKNTSAAALAAKAKALTTGFDDMSWDMDGLTSQAAKSMSMLKTPAASEDQDH